MFFTVVLFSIIIFRRLHLQTFIDKVWNAIYSFFFTFQFKTYLSILILFSEQVSSPGKIPQLLF